MRILAATITLFALTTVPALADKGARAACMTHAEQLAAGAGAYGYQQRYTAALNACLGQGQVYSTRYQGYHPRPGGRPYINVEARNCPPGAPKMYRGTLYCTN